MFTSKPTVHDVNSEHDLDIFRQKCGGNYNRKIQNSTRKKVKINL